MIQRKIEFNFPQEIDIHKNKICILDIETTGLQKYNSIIYLIGCAYSHAPGAYTCIQWFAENPDQEAEILQTFDNFLSDFSYILNFNGNNFDIPFLVQRMEFHKVPITFTKKESIDLYSILRPWKRLLGLSHMRQKDLEGLFKISRQQDISGKDCIQVYRNVIKFRDTSLAEPIFRHNLWDLQGLMQLSALRFLPTLLEESSYTLRDVRTTAAPSSLQLHYLLPYSLPVDLYLSYDEFSISYKGNLCTLEIHPINGKLRNFYPDYKNYYFLPQEQTAMHKSIGAYVDKSLREKCTPHNCYSTFPFHEDFTENQDRMEHYGRHNIPILLSLCK